jgi:3-dehydroquinate dehydratase-2
MMKNILVIHGPNLNMLGQREPETYGYVTLEDINSELNKKAEQFKINITCFQSNHEGEIVDKLQKSFKKIDGLIINPAAYTHTSVAIRDAVLLLDIPTIEVHISNIYKRESFRHNSYLSDIVTGQIAGVGVIGYYLALEALNEIID